MDYTIVMTGPTDTETGPTEAGARRCENDRVTSHESRVATARAPDWAEAGRQSFAEITQDDIVGALALAKVLQLVPWYGFTVDGMEILVNTDACTLPTAERPPRLAEFDALFATNVRRIERRGADVRMHLTGDDGLTDLVRDLIERETSCCSFFTFNLTGTDQDLTLDVSVPLARQEILDALAERALELSA